MKDGEREQPIENYRKKEQKEWLDNILPYPHPCTAGNMEEEHTYNMCVYTCVHACTRVCMRASCTALFSR